MATKAETKLTELERTIKESSTEIERIESIVSDIDVQLDKAHKAFLAHQAEAAEEKKRADVLGGWAELGKLDSGLKAELLKVKDRLLKLGDSRKTLPSIDDLNEKKRLIIAALAVEKDKAHELELSYPVAVKALNMERAEKELVVFMELSEKIAASVTKLAVLNDELDGEVFYSGSGFVLPLPLIEPFHAKADGLHYHQDNLQQYNAIPYVFGNMLRDDIIKAGGMKWLG